MSENIILALIGLGILIISVIGVILYFNKSSYIGTLVFDKKTREAYFSFNVDPNKLRNGSRYSIKVKQIKGE